MKVLSIRKVNTRDLDTLRYTEVATETKRQLREPILRAFDIYKSNVYYGVVTETDAEHYEILYWYQLLLDLDEYALNNVPKAIAKYIKE